MNKLIANSNLAITDAEQFMDQLSKNLQDLDGANVQSVLVSEQQVNALMEQIEVAIEEANRVEARYDEYEDILCHVRDTMEKMGEKNSMIEIANNNSISLLNLLNQIIIQLDLSSAHQQALNQTDLKTPEGLKAAIDAGKALQTAMNCDIDAALLRLTAVQDQRKRFDKWKVQFSQTISRHLNNMFIHCANDLGELNQHSTANAELVLKIHSDVHNALCGQKELMHWLKSMDRKAYDGLTKVYTSVSTKSKNIIYFELLVISYLYLYISIQYFSFILL